MTKRRPFKKVKPGEPIPVTARQLEGFMLEHKGRFYSCDYDNFERMELMELPVHDAIHELNLFPRNTSTALCCTPLGAVSVFLRG